jgi:YfiH family protein
MTAVFFWRHVLDAEPERHGVHFAFTSRLGGCSTPPWDSLNLGGRTGDSPQNVETNRDAVAATIDVPRDRLLFMNQCHGDAVVVVDGPWTAEAAAADGLVTSRNDLAVAALTADCVPVLLADPRAGVVGAVHAGRPGMVARVVDRAVDVMTGQGARADNIVAAVGPSVCGRCYEVPEEMRAQAAAVSAVSATVSWAGTPAIDVAAGVVDQLTSRGVAVTWVPGCTREDRSLFSFRRDGTTGRFAGIVWLLPPALLSPSRPYVSAGASA